MDENQNTNNAGEASSVPAPVTAPAAEKKSDDQHRKLMGVLAYMGPLVIIPYLVAREDSFVKFHIEQGLVLFIISLLVWFASSLTWFLMPIWAIVNFVILVLAFIGILNVLKDEKKEIPFVGHYSTKIKI